MTTREKKATGIGVPQVVHDAITHMATGGIVKHAVLTGAVYLLLHLFEHDRAEAGKWIAKAMEEWGTERGHPDESRFDWSTPTPRGAAPLPQAPEVGADRGRTRKRKAG